MPSPYITSNSTVLNGGATLFFTTLTLRLVAHRVVADLERPDAPDVQPHAGVELQRPPPGVVSGEPNITPIFSLQLVDEDRRRPRPAERPRELPQGLAHQPGLKPHVRVSHLTLDLSPRHQGGDGVDDDDVEGAAPDEGVGDLQGLLAVVGLGEVQVLEVHADGLGVGRVEGVLGVDEGGEARRLSGPRR